MKIFHLFLYVTKKKNKKIIVPKVDTNNLIKTEDSKHRFRHYF